MTDEQRQAFDAYLEEVRKASDIDRMATDRPKTGVFLGVHAVNPVTGERIPVWAADYVLADYGTGAIMAVPGRDQRDYDFAKAFDLPIVAHRAAAGGLGGRGLRRRRPGHQLRQRRDLAERHGRRPRRSRTIIAWLESQGPGQRHRQLPAARLAAVAPAVLGRADPDHPLPGLRRGGGARRTSCPSYCPSCAAPT